MIERNDWKLFIQIVVLVASIFIADVLDNFTCMALIMMVSAIFFVQHIKNKFELIRGFDEKNLELNTFTENIKSSLKNKKIHEDNDNIPTDVKKKLEAKFFEENLKDYDKIKNCGKKIEINTQRKDFILFLCTKKWSLWFAILLSIASLRALALANIISFSSLMSSFIALISCIYIFKSEFKEFGKSIASNIEYDLSYMLYRAKVIFTTILTIFLINGILAKQNNLPIFSSLFLYILMIIISAYAIKSLWSEDAKKPKQCTIEYMAKYQEQNIKKTELISNKIKQYQYDIINTLNVNSSLLKTSNKTPI